jgi:hypothetical protein
MWISITVSLIIIVICHHIYLHFQPEYKPRVHSHKYNAIYDELIKIENDINAIQEAKEEDPDAIPPPDRPAEAEISNL